MFWKFSLSYLLFVCMCLCCLQGYTVCGRGIYRGGIHTHINGILLWHLLFLFILFLDRVPRWICGLLAILDWLANKPKDAPVLAPVATGISEDCLYTWLLHGCRGLELLPSHLHSRHLLLHAPGMLSNFEEHIWSLCLATFSGRGLRPH